MKELFRLTTTARDYIRFVCQEQEMRAVKLEVKGGGCSGFIYNYNFVDEPEDGDLEIDLLTCKFIVDSMSIMYVAGTELDYEQDIGGSSLKLRNPNQKAGCGCGKSFSV